MSISRRKFIHMLGAGGVLSGTGLSMSSKLLAASDAKAAHVVVVGGGFGGATAAKYIRKLDPSITVTLIEPNKYYTTCPGSNWVLGGLRNMKSITHDYSKLVSDHGVKVIQDLVTSIDARSRKVTLKNGGNLNYDRLVVSPGIDFRWDTIDGYDAKVATDIPHAWQAGPQTEILRKQLHAMKDGGTVVIAVPPNPFRCPPGPYERASMIAHYLKENKPRSKLLILDAKDKFSKQGLFTQGWSALYDYGTENSLIEWVPLGKGGKVTGIEAKTRLAITEFDTHKADVLNIIPAQKAGKIAVTAGLTDKTGWCPVHYKTFESTIHPGIHVIGDASIAAPLPKSGYAANSEAKVCAFAVVAMLKGQEPGTPTWVNTCYSLVGPRHGISVAMVYELTKGGILSKVKGAGGVTPKDGHFKKEAAYTESWYDNITNDIFG